MGFKITVEMDLEGLRERLQQRIDNAQNMLTQECKKWADKYTPMQTGALKNEANPVFTHNEHGARDGWIYNVPYARRQWYGTRKDGSDFQYSAIAHGKKDESKAGTPTNARKRWTEHAVLIHKDDILKVVKAVLTL